MAPQGATSGAYRPPAGAQAAPAHRLAGGSPPPTPYGGTPRAGGTPVGGHSSGNYPARSGGGSVADNKVVWIVLGVVALVALVVILVAASSGADESGGGSSGGDTSESGDGGADATPSGYTQEVEAAFVGSCSGQSSSSEAMCQCAWDSIVEQIPFEDFAAMEEQIRADPELASDADAMASTFPELQTIMTDCADAA